MSIDIEYTVGIGKDIWYGYSSNSLIKFMEFKCRLAFDYHCLTFNFICFEWVNLDLEVINMDPFSKKSFYRTGFLTRVHL